MGPCFSCHDDITTVLSSAHPAIKSTDLQSCMECHTPEERGVAKPNTFAVRLHRTHLQDPVKADCLDCHSWEQAEHLGFLELRSFGAPTEEDLALMKEIFGEEMASTIWGPGMLQRVLGVPDVTVKILPGTGGVVGNAVCLGCHQPVEDLIVKTTPKEFPDRNPHKSHLGEISCTVCHFAHGESKVYCLECHPKFEMKLE